MARRRRSARVPYRGFEIAFPLQGRGPCRILFGGKRYAGDAEFDDLDAAFDLIDEERRQRFDSFSVLRADYGQRIVAARNAARIAAAAIQKKAELAE